MLYTQIGKIGKLLLPSDIPKYITVDGVNYKVHEKLSHIGSFTVVNEEFDMESIDMMNDILTEFSHFLLCIGESTISVIQQMLMHITYMIPIAEILLVSLYQMALLFCEHLIH